VENKLKLRLTNYSRYPHMRNLYFVNYFRALNVTCKFVLANTYCAVCSERTTVASPAHGI